MDPISALGALQTGFSIATTLTGYISSVKDAKEDIQSLASELDSTLRHLQELEESKTTGRGLSTNGRALIDNVKKDSENLIRRLVQLLKNTKSDVIISPDRPFRREDIDVSIFRKAVWPAHKPEVEQIRQKLVTIKLSILLARSVQESQTSKSSTDRKSARDRLASLARTRSDALKRLRRMEQGKRTRFAEPASSESEPVNDDDDDVALHEEIRADVLRELEQEQADKRRVQAEKDELEARAVITYKQGLLESFAKLRKDRMDLIEDLETSFEPSVSRRQINEYAKKHQLSQIQDEELKNLSEQLQQLYPVTSTVEPVEPSGPQYGLGRLFKRKSLLPAGLQRRDAHPDSALIVSVIVQTDDRYPTVDPIHVSMPWLIEHMRREEKTSRHSTNPMTTTMKIWGDISRHRRHAVHTWLNRYSGRRSEMWSLVFAREHRVPSTRRAKIFRRLIGAERFLHDPLSIILVFRQTRFFEEVTVDDHGPIPRRPDHDRARRRRGAPRGPRPPYVDSDDDDDSPWHYPPRPTFSAYPPPPGVVPSYMPDDGISDATGRAYSLYRGRVRSRDPLDDNLDWNDPYAYGDPGPSVSRRSSFGHPQSAYLSERPRPDPSVVSYSMTEDRTRVENKDLEQERELRRKREYAEHMAREARTQNKMEKARTHSRSRSVSKRDKSAVRERASNRAEARSVRSTLKHAPSRASQSSTESEDEENDEELTQQILAQYAEAVENEELPNGGPAEPQDNSEHEDQNFVTVREEEEDDDNNNAVYSPPA